MGVAKVTLNGNTLMDTTGKTVAADKMLASYTALDKAGNSVTGSIATKTSSNLTANGATVTAPAGFYASDASKSVSMMTLPTAASSASSGTLKATIGRSTSAQYINIPTGYNSIASYYTVSATANMTLPTAASSTSSGTSKATISRSTSAQYINIPTGYNATASYYTVSAVANGTAGTPTATKGTVSNHQVSVTPSVTNTTGYITGSTKTGTAVTVTASELASGNKEITSNGTGIDVVGYSTVSVNVSPTYTCTILSGHTYYSDSAFVTIGGIRYYNAGDTATFHAGDTIQIYAVGRQPVIIINGTPVEEGAGSWASYSYTAPASDIEVSFSAAQAVVNSVAPPTLTYESGTYTPTTDIARPTISFTNTHTLPPMLIMLEDTSSGTYASDAPADTAIWWTFNDWYRMTEIGVASSSSSTQYGRVQFGYRSTAGGAISTTGYGLSYNSDNTGDYTNAYSRYWATPTGFRPYAGSTSVYWRTGHTYKWIAVWAP